MSAEGLIRARKDRALCVCWDCLRARGITPPLGIRAKHRIYPSEFIPQGPGYDFKLSLKQETDDA